MIKIENLRKRYGKVEALSGLSLDVFSNEILGIVGPSGCGKTTLLRLVAGLERPDDGKIWIDGMEASTPEHRVSPRERKSAMIFQDLALWPHMTVGEHVAFMMKRGTQPKDHHGSHIDKLLRDVNLNGYVNRYPHELSGGEKQRLAIVRALASEPVYLLMDEPFSQLDTILREGLQELVMGLKDTMQMGIIYVSHHIQDVLVMADRVAVMDEGDVRQVGTKEEVLRDPRDASVRRLLKT